MHVISFAQAYFTMSYRPPKCINSNCSSHAKQNFSFHKVGSFYIKRLKQRVTRFRCSDCGRVCSSRSFKLDYRHKKMDLNYKLAQLLVEGNSIRGCSRILGLTYKSTYLKFLWLKKVVTHKKSLIQYRDEEIQFDELETIHHTKCKPLSIAVVTGKEYLLNLKVAEMPAKGKLAQISLAKYGPRKDQRAETIEGALKEVKEKLVKAEGIKIKSDAHPAYKKIVEQVFLCVDYKQHSRRGNIEKLRLKVHESSHKKRFDPLFDVNHACALLRSQIKRLVRRSWCTTKKVENLQIHLDLFIIMQFCKSF